MNEHKNLNINDQRVLDLLADGELSQEQERDVLLELDRHPDRWRRCALTFLETRVWQCEVPRIEALKPIAHPGPKKSDSADGTWYNRWTWALAMAAIFLLAVGIGRMFPLAQPAGKTLNGPTIANAPVTPPTVASVQQQPDRTSDMIPPPTLASSTNQPVGDLTFVDDAGRSVEVPVFDWNRQNADRLLFQPEPLPQELVRNLKRHEVRRHQRYVPVQLEDGRHVLVPVQELDIVPVPDTAY